MLVILKTRMKISLQIVGILLQMLLPVSQYAFFKGILGIASNFQSGDPKLLAGLISGVIISSLVLIPALIGIAISLYTLKKWSDHSLTILNINKLYSYLWIIFIPIGTFLGLKQNRLVKDLTNKRLKVMDGAERRPLA